MPEASHPDLCVIGAGPGGLAAAMAAAVAGAKVVLVERARFDGRGAGASPLLSKSLIAAARQMRAANAPVDFARVRAQGQNALDRAAPGRAAPRLKALGVRVLYGAARFTGPRQIEAGGEIVDARRFIVATGSTPVLPPVLGIETVRAWTTDTIFDLAELPRHLVVLGSDPVGLELAQAFLRLGSAVTLVAMGAIALAEDPELAEIALAALREDGLVLQAPASVARIDPTPDGLRLSLEGGAAIEASHLLVATARQPNVAGLGLDAAGIRFDRNGIAVGRDLRTSNRQVFAIGDVVAGPPCAHRAAYQGGLVVRNILLGARIRFDSTQVPRVTYTNPEIAITGLTEQQAREAGHRITILRWPFTENDRALAEMQTRGHIKVVCGRKGEILGAGIVGARAGELISMWQLAVCRRMKIGDIAQVMLPTPTLGEVSQRAAVLSYASALRSPWVKRLMRFLRLLR